MNILIKLWHVVCEILRCHACFNASYMLQYDFVKDCVLFKELLSFWFPIWGFFLCLVISWYDIHYPILVLPDLCWVFFIIFRRLATLAHSRCQRTLWLTIFVSSNVYFCSRYIYVQCATHTVQLNVFFIGSIWSVADFILFLVTFAFEGRISHIFVL